MKNTFLRELLQEALSADDAIMIDMITEALRITEGGIDNENDYY